MKKILLALSALFCCTIISACEANVESSDSGTPPHLSGGGNTNDNKPDDGDDDKDELYAKKDGFIRLVSYNVGVFSKSMKNSTVMVASMMKELDADVIAVNEVDKMTIRHKTDQVRDFADALGGWNYHFGEAMEFQGGSYGDGLVFKKDFKVIDRFEVKLPMQGGVKEEEPRVLVVVETEKFVFASTHLDHMAKDGRLAQAKHITYTLKNKYGSTKKPVFLCGDMNCVPDDAPIVELKKDWTMLSVPEATYPSDRPRMCIDYIMVLNNGAEYEAGKSDVCVKFSSGDVVKASDHLPVFADVRLK